MGTKRLRCAVYTGKSTEEGLDQEFNSLHAQREACESYIKSQRHEGWTLVRDRFDDGGLSGATMARPALRRLLDEVRARRVDVIVVYKVDRLTRALSDFAKMVEVFDQHDVSFVSVTQQFNTTTSMGRLTLNVLLSFAQFEREVTAERIRDKIAASKSKGMWMGGVVPLGYEAVDRRLVIHRDQAKTIRTLFELYLDLGNVGQVKQEAARRGLRTRPRRADGGSEVEGRPFTRGHIYKILSSPIYAGEVVHKDKRYAGEHEAIIDATTWERVQEQLKRNAVNRRSGANAKMPSLLAGLLFDQSGEAMVPSHASKAGRRYRYYISRSLAEGRAAAGEGWRIPAAQIDGPVVEEICCLLGDGPRLMHILASPGGSADRLNQLLGRAGDMQERLSRGEPAARRTVVTQILRRADLCSDALHLTWDARGLAALLGTEASDIPCGGDERALTLQRPVALRRRGVEMKLLLSDGRSQPVAADAKLVGAVARAHTWLPEVLGGTAGSLRELARRVGCDRADLGRQLRLAFLAPDIVEAIIEGRQPLDLTVARLRRLGDLPVLWSEQRKLLGFHR